MQAWTPGAPLADAAVVWAPPQAFFDEQHQLRTVYNIGAGVDAIMGLRLPPKIAPSALANAIVGALKSGVEDVYPGDIAQDWLARWRENPKALEVEAATP